MLYSNGCIIHPMAGNEMVGNETELQMDTNIMMMMMMMTK